MECTSTQLLRNLEISLRTNPIGWVRLFLSEQHNGLDILVDYLTMTQEYMRVTNFSFRRSIKSRVPKFHHNGFAMNDVHVCIMCLRAIMNHQYGFNLVFGHEQAINSIALSLNHKSYRTKTLVLELLAAVCLVSGGHQMILSAFDNFKTVCGEIHRFQTLMYYFQHYEEFHIDFMVACMQFINIIVHSVENMNFRVHLQHEFSLLGLDDYLQKLRHTESERLPIQVNAYLDNTIEVQTLLDESDLKTVALERVSELQEELTVPGGLPTSSSSLASTPTTPKSFVPPKSPTASASSSFAPPPMPPMPPPLPPSTVPLPPPLAPPFGAPPPPPPMGLPGITIKKAIQPTYRLPVLNWISMKPNEVKGTMFNDLDDEKLYKVLDFKEFEDLFKLGNMALLDVDMPDTASATIKPKKKQEKLSLLESNRLRNVAITRRKIEIRDDEIVKAINTIDLQKLTLERVEILIRVMPNEQETKLFKEYEKDKKPLDMLSDEDRFMIYLMKVERLPQKLMIMSFIGNFFDTFHILQPQLHAICDAALSIKESKKLRKLFEVILAFGNYMNSCKRGAVYGFRLQSLDMLTDTKSNDKKITLLHFIVKSVREKFPDILTFDCEIRHLEKAAPVSLENILSDISELDKGMELTRREYEHRKDRDVPIILKDFVSNADDKIKKLKIEAKQAQDIYSQVVEYFGENVKTLSPSTFFNLFLRFIKAFKVARFSFIPEETVVGELKQKQQRIREKKVLNRDEIGHGTLEDILTNLKSEPYRRADAVRRSMRKKSDLKPVVNAAATAVVL
ncbi:hypothetical protein HELRODRAFT_155739 [Helobdella robusta]|uniref:FH2 domain-containing protein n=1 Tax=Helobdella robusta TaxID=6412 RepID=T1ELL7_HELRO|nr:hypothetical protein HELRODRAFT_155739 [Helobdella robusta]ESO06680.1 hypothetical protein HELRODRAFT_155739 [Helobdella robusta]